MNRRNAIHPLGHALDGEINHHDPVLFHNTDEQEDTNIGVKREFLLED